MSQLARPDFDPNVGFTPATLACLGLRPKSLLERQGRMAERTRKPSPTSGTSSRTNVGPDKDSDERRARQHRGVRQGTAGLGDRSRHVLRRGGERRGSCSSRPGRVFPRHFSKPLLRVAAARLTPARPAAGGGSAAVVPLRSNWRRGQGEAPPWPGGVGEERMGRPAEAEEEAGAFGRLEMSLGKGARAGQWLRWSPRPSTAMRPS